jgi:6-phosphogluconolactonase
MASFNLLIVFPTSGGSIALFRMEPNGSIGEMCDFHQFEGKSVNPIRQEKAHAHMVMFDLSERFLFVPGEREAAI